MTTTLTIAAAAAASKEFWLLGAEKSV